jgi:ubiquinone/menaquinone biosynthesis C-methylase UbiE
MSEYVLSSLAKIDDLGNGQFLISNGVNIKRIISQALVDVLNMFRQPQDTGTILALHSDSPELKTILEQMKKDLLLVAATPDHQEEMRATWNCLAKGSAEDAAFFIDNDSKTMAEFEEAGDDAIIALQQLIELDKDWQAASIGCGMGRLERPLSKHVKVLSGFDVSDTMIERAREYLAECTNVNLVRTDGDLIGIDDGTLDLVISFLVFQHIPKEATWHYFREASRVLGQQGHFVFQIHCYNNMEGYEQSDYSPIGRYYGSGKERYLEQEVRDQLESAGFEIKMFRNGAYDGIERCLTGTPSTHWESKLVHAVKA